VTGNFDALVVGAGPTGLACGIELGQRGLKTVLIEKGCVVTRSTTITNLVFFTTPELLEIGNIPMTSLAEKPGRTEALKYYRRVADHYKLDIHQYERVDAITGSDGAFQVATTDRLAVKTYMEHAKMYLPPAIMTSEYARCARRDLDKVLHYYKEAHPYYQSGRNRRRSQNSRPSGAGTALDQARVTLCIVGAISIR